MDTEERFLSKLSSLDKCDCWKFCGYHDKDGYPTFYNGVTTLRAVRFAYELLIGSVQQGNQLNHGCDNRWCVNPWHCYQGTQKDNMHDRLNRNRASYKGRPRFTEDDKLIMLTMRSNGWSQEAIAKVFSTNQSVVSRLIRGITNPREPK